MENTTKALSPKMRAWLEVKDYLIIIIGMLINNVNINKIFIKIY